MPKRWNRDRKNGNRLGDFMPPKIASWAFCARCARDVLGFEVLWADAADWRLVQRDSVRVMLGHCPNGMTPAALGSHNWFGYIDVNDVDALYTEISTRGADCTPPANRPYGMREIVVTTVDGHRIVFGEDVPKSNSN
jgi:hypothetical protein